MYLETHHKTPSPSPLRGLQLGWNDYLNLEVTGIIEPPSEQEDPEFLMALRICKFLAHREVIFFWKSEIPKP